MMDIYICSSWSESFSLTIVESALQGKPIISTDVGIIRDIVKDENLISEEGDSEAIAKSVIKLLDYKKFNSWWIDAGTEERIEQLKRLLDNSHA